MCRRKRQNACLCNPVMRYSDAGQKLSEIVRNLKQKDARTDTLSKRAAGCMVRVQCCSATVTQYTMTCMYVSLTQILLSRQRTAERRVAHFPWWWRVAGNARSKRSSHQNATRVMNFNYWTVARKMKKMQPIVAPRRDQRCCFKG